jgi:hypothetical protein
VNKLCLQLAKCVHRASVDDFILDCVPVDSDGIALTIPVVFIDSLDDRVFDDDDVSIATITVDVGGGGGFGTLLFEFGIRRGGISVVGRVGDERWRKTECVSLGVVARGFGGRGRKDEFDGWLSAKVLCEAVHFLCL